MSLKSWREVAIPHEDVREGTFQQAEFAADLSRVHQKTAVPEYQDPGLFFQRTFITEGMSQLLISVIKRLSGQGGDPVIQLQTAFGGGKTHSLLAVYHLVKGEISTRKMQGISSLLDQSGVAHLPKARVAVLDGIQLAPSTPREQEGLLLRTLWGDLAWQLGGEEGYRMVEEADRTGTSPGKELLAQVIRRYSPSVILIDELVSYIRQFPPSQVLSGGTYGSNLSFIQALTEAMKAVPNAVLLVSLPESNREAGGDRGNDVLQTLEYYFGRVQAIWRPVSTEESFEIVRRRLFSEIVDPDAAAKVCEAFVAMYRDRAGDFPLKARESAYADRLRRSYPIHPEVLDRLYEDWSTLETFQRTRGVLRLMAKIIHQLWVNENKDFLILPSNFPLADGEVRSTILQPLPQGWDPVLEKDIDGERSEAAAIEVKEPRFGALQACRRVGRTIFLGSAPTTSAQQVRGIELDEILLGSVQPGWEPGLFRDAIKRLTDRLHYLNHANNRYWFDTRPNLRREMEDRKGRFDDQILEMLLRDKLKKNLDLGIFGGVHIFAKSGDIPDDGALRLVVLPFVDALNVGSPQFAFKQAEVTLKYRGDLPRQNQNRLVFLFADHGTVDTLKDQLRTILAWQSIVADVGELRINLDQFQTRQAKKSYEESLTVLDRTLRESYKWLVVPGQEGAPGKIGNIRWEKFPLSPNAPHFTKEIERVLREHELVIWDWSPIHLHGILKTWFWKADISDVAALEVWQKMATYLYFPRLMNEEVYRKTLEKGLEFSEFFGLAEGKENGHYLGLRFNQPGQVTLNSTLLLVHPETARQMAEERDVSTSKVSGDGEVLTPLPRPGTGNPRDGRIQSPSPVSSGKNQFFGTVALDPMAPKSQFQQIFEEVLRHFNERPDVSLEVSLDIHARTTREFNGDFQRTIKENCRELKFKNSEFSEDQEG